MAREIGPWIGGALLALAMVLSYSAVQAAFPAHVSPIVHKTSSPRCMAPCPLQGTDDGLQCPLGLPIKEKAPGERGL